MEKREQAKKDLKGLEETVVGKMSMKKTEKDSRLSGEAALLSVQDLILSSTPAVNINWSYSW